jgi:hypothetical protein
MLPLYVRDVPARGKGRLELTKTQGDVVLCVCQPSFSCRDQELIGYEFAVTPTTSRTADVVSSYLLQ